MKQNDVVELMEAYMWVVITGVVSLSAWYLDVHFVLTTSNCFQGQLKIQYMFLRVRQSTTEERPWCVFMWWAAHCMNIFWWTFGLWAQIVDDQIECAVLQHHVWDVLW
jgi:hypothetical protein